MEKEFNLLKVNYPASGYHEFETVTRRIMEAKLQRDLVKTKMGRDEGIDFIDMEKMTVYQCKFFSNEIRLGQMYDSIKSTHKHWKELIKEYIFCVPNLPESSELRSFLKWKTKVEHEFGYKVGVIWGDSLVKYAGETKVYQEVFPFMQESKIDLLIENTLPPEQIQMKIEVIKEYNLLGIAILTLLLNTFLVLPRIPGEIPLLLYLVDIGFIMMLTSVLITTKQRVLQIPFGRLLFLRNGAWRVQRIRLKGQCGQCKQELNGYNDSNGVLFAKCSNEHKYLIRKNFIGQLIVLEIHQNKK